MSTGPRKAEEADQTAVDSAETTDENADVAEIRALLDDYVPHAVPPWQRQHTPDAAGANAAAYAHDARAVPRGRDTLPMQVQSVELNVTPAPSRDATTEPGRREPEATTDIPTRLLVHREARTTFRKIVAQLAAAEEAAPSRRRPVGNLAIVLLGALAVSGIAIAATLHYRAGALPPVPASAAAVGPAMVASPGTAPADLASKPTAAAPAKPPATAPADLASKPSTATALATSSAVTVQAPNPPKPPAARAPTRTAASIAPPAPSAVPPPPPVTAAPAATAPKPVPKDDVSRTF